MDEFLPGFIGHHFEGGVVAGPGAGFEVAVFHLFQFGGGFDEIAAIDME